MSLCTTGNWEIMQIYICHDYTRARLHVGVAAGLLLTSTVMTQDLAMSTSSLLLQLTVHISPLIHRLHCSNILHLHHCACSHITHHILKDYIIPTRHNSNNQASSPPPEGVILLFVQLCLNEWAGAQLSGSQWTSCNRLINNCCIMDESPSS